jgi:predicted dehydrogenase
MIRDDLIDVITIAVNVPAHRELVHAALSAGKAVYCEVPLGRTVAEAEEMASAVGSLHTAIGLQGRHNPAAQRAAELVSSGRIGRPLTATIVSPTVGFGPEMPVAHDLFNKSSSGANLLTISGGHTLDLVEAVLGPIVEVDARSEIRWPIVKLTETGEQSARDTADYFGIAGKTRSGAAFAAELEAGVPPELVRFSFKVTGSDGWLSLTSNHPYGFQAGDLELNSSIAINAPNTAEVSGGFVGAATNVGQVYAQLVRDLHAGTYKTPGFQHALHNARLIEAVKRAAELGKRQKLPGLVREQRERKRKKVSYASQA